MAQENKVVDMPAPDPEGTVTIAGDEKEVRKWKKARKAEEEEFENSPLGKAKAQIKELEEDIKKLKVQLNDNIQDQITLSQRLGEERKETKKWRDKFSMTKSFVGQAYQFMTKALEVGK